MGLGLQQQLDVRAWKGLGSGREVLKGVRLDQLIAAFHQSSLEGILGL